MNERLIWMVAVIAIVEFLYIAITLLYKLVDKLHRKHVKKKKEKEDMFMTYFLETYETLIINCISNVATNMHMRNIDFRYDDLVNDILSNIKSDRVSKFITAVMMDIRHMAKDEYTPAKTKRDLLTFTNDYRNQIYTIIENYMLRISFSDAHNSIDRQVDEFPISDDDKEELKDVAKKLYDATAKINMFEPKKEDLDLASQIFKENIPREVRKAIKDNNDQLEEMIDSLEYNRKVAKKEDNTIDITKYL